MALLQIAEPGQSLAPHQRRIAVGIDLGTTNSLVAAMKNALPEVLADDQGRKLLPSVIRYLPGGATQAGYQAMQNANGDPKNTIISVKRFMGRGLKDVAHAESMPYEFIDAPGLLTLKTISCDQSPFAFSSDLLSLFLPLSSSS
ncbi:MAG: Hsp70 family protein, partial [Polynucleobacter victoriensis]